MSEPSTPGNLEMTALEECNALIDAIREMLVVETAACIESGAAVLELQDAVAELQPIVDVRAR